MLCSGRWVLACPTEQCATQAIGFRPSTQYAALQGWADVQCMESNPRPCHVKSTIGRLRIFQDFWNCRIITGSKESSERTQQLKRKGISSSLFLIILFSFPTCPLMNPVGNESEPLSTYSVLFFRGNFILCKIILLHQFLKNTVGLSMCQAVC